MASEITVHESDDFGNIRTLVVDDEIWFVASDVAKALGYRDAATMTRSLDEDEKGYALLRTPGGEQQALTVNEYGLYRACMARKVGCIKDEAMRANVERFQRWITHEVLPSIRRHGAYVNPSGAESDEELFARALEAAHAIIARRESRIRELEESAEAQRPMAELGEAVSASDTSIQIGDMARILQQNGCPWAGRNRLFRRLRDDGYLGTEGSGMYNRPLQRHMERDLFEVQESTFKKPDGTVGIRITTYVTPKGQRHLLERYAGLDAVQGALPDAGTEVA